MIPQKALKLLALALDPAAHVGEWHNASVMFVSILRKTGYSADLLDKPAPAPSRPPPSRRSTAKMPFGMHKGKPLSDIPTDYLEWLIDLPDLKPTLRRQVTAEINKRE